MTQINTALNTNHAWLAIAAGRLLDGGHELTDFYEPNPPLSILLYVPAVLLSRLAGIPLYYTPYLVGFAALLLSAWTIFLLLEKWPGRDRHQNTVFVFAYVLACTFLATNIYFAERDEFVVWGLVPFLIVQMAITRNVPLPRALVWPVLIPGTAAILIKFHYGLFPVLLLLHRIMQRKNVLSVLRDADFLALAGGTLVYAAVTIAFFPDYLSTVFPDFMKFYLPVHSSFMGKNVVIGLGFAGAMAASAALFEFPAALLRTSLLCCAAAALAIGLFGLQGKGFYYHLIPAAVFFYCGMGTILYGLAAKACRNQAAGTWTTAVILTALAYHVAPLNTGFPTHDQYRALRLPRLAEEAGPGETFFAFSENMEMIFQASIYSGVAHASRFPGLWWLPGLEELQGAEHERKFKQYAGYVAEDLRRYKPRVMAIAVNLGANGKPGFDLIGYLDHEPAFRKEMRHYRKDGQMKDNRRDYFRGTTIDSDFPIVYDVYRRVL